MDASTYDELIDLLETLTKERNGIQKNIDDNNLHIHEAQNFENEIMSRNEEDFKVFSPRKYEDIYRAELHESNDRKINYENKNRTLIEKKDKLDSIIHVLEASAFDWKREADAKEQQLKDGLISERSIVENKLFTLEVQEEKNGKLIDQLNQTVIQELSYAMSKLEIAFKFIGQDPARAKLELDSVSKNIQQSVTATRNIIFELCPMDFQQFTFEEAIHKMITVFNQNKKYELDIRIDELKNVSCEKFKNMACMLSIYKVIQEALLNIRKYADAKKILFHCSCMENNLVIHLEDDGRGFDAKILENEDVLKKCFGISMMREIVFLLNGKLEILTSPDHGTKILIEIPME